MNINPILLCFLFFSFFACHSEPTMEIQGHRGCKGLMPENTIPAFKKAIELGVHVLEMDVVISKDKKVIVSHEPYMNPDICLDPNGNRIDENEKYPFNIYQLTYKEIKEFDCGSIQHPDCPRQKILPAFKPLLADVIKMAEERSSTIKYNIEIKSDPAVYDIFNPKPDEFVSLVLGVLNEFELDDRVNLQSFDLRTLEEIKRQSPDMIQALLIDEGEEIDVKKDQLSFKPEILSPYYKLLTPENVKTYQYQGFQVIPWTVNQTEDMLKVVSYNVDAIITDYPVILKGIIEEYHAE